MIKFQKSCTRNENISGLYIKRKQRRCMKMKRLTKLVCVFTFIFWISSLGVMAKEVETSIQPLNLYTEEFWGDISISDSGVASVKAKCTSSASNIEKIILHVYLQKYVNEEWRNIQYWQATSQTRICTLNRSTTVTHGSSYRVKVSCNVITSGGSEQIEIYTPSKWY